MPGNRHAPIWNSGRRGDASADCNRLNLDFRQHVAAIGRRVNTLCKHEAGLRQQLAIFHTYHNFVLPHASLRVPLPNVIQGTESVHRWQPQTPAGGRADRSRVEPARGADVACATMAAAIR